MLRWIWLIVLMILGALNNFASCPTVNWGAT